MKTKSQSQVRIKRGQKITALADLQKFQSHINGERLLVGSASNYEAVRNDSVLYSDNELYQRMHLYVPYEGMAAVNLALGAMGKGKTTLLNNVIAERPNANIIIHDPKGEYNQCFYDETKDMIVGHQDSGSVIWDVFEEIRKDRQVGELIWRNKLLSVQGEGNKNGVQWVTYAVPWLMRLAAAIVDTNIERKNIPSEIIRLYKEYKSAVGGQQSGMQSDALGTAAPIFNLLFQMYYIGVKDNRRFVTIEDMTKTRRVFLCNSKQFASTLDIVNNALLACLINKYMSRPNIPREQTDKYVYFILDEFLTFKLDQNSEAALLTLCRSKGISVWLGMQNLPSNKDRLTRITQSRYITAVFRVDDAYTREEIEKLSEDIEYQRIEDTVAASDSGGGLFSMSLGFNWNEFLVDVKTKQVTKEMLAELSPYVAFLEINDLAGRHRTFVKPAFIKTLKNPCRVNEEAGEEGFLYSDVARFAPRIEEFV
ncbi:MAG: type IV secretion system DNA-binding domain-containing protein [Betaproteobacteria bacterium]|nr:type IV secretion system DNA-binding domain-containing protein [Betaproteobacteria bacterium]